jgi:hypothetical protein
LGARIRAWRLAFLYGHCWSLDFGSPFIGMVGGLGSESACASNLHSVLWSDYVPITRGGAVARRRLLACALRDLARLRHAK